MFVVMLVRSRLLFVGILLGVVASGSESLPLDTFKLHPFEMRICMPSLDALAELSMSRHRRLVNDVLTVDYAGCDRAHRIGSWPGYLQEPPSVARWDLLLLYIPVNYSVILEVHDDRFGCLVRPFSVPAAVHF